MYPKANIEKVNDISQREMCRLGHLLVFFQMAKSVKEVKFEWEIVWDSRYSRPFDDISCVSGFFF